MDYVFAYDVGTSSLKTALVDINGNIIGHAREEYPLYYPNPGWAEQDPDDYWNAVIKTTREIMEKSKIAPEDVKGLIFTTQALGIIPVDKDGNLLNRNITWVDSRAEKQAKQVMRRFGGKSIFYKIFGIEISGKDVIPKIMWMKQNMREIYDKTDKILDVNGFLKFRATGERVAEWSGACSYAFDLKKKDFDRLTFKFVGIDTNKLPRLVRSIDKVGDGLTQKAAEELGLIKGTPVFGGIDDVEGATVGSTAIEEGEAHIYLGTSGWFVVSTSKMPKFKNGAVTMQSADPEKQIVLGEIEAAGSNVEWAIREYYRHIDMKEDVFQYLDHDISSVKPGSEHLIFTPWMHGERCPVSTTTTRATIFNLSHEHKSEHIIRALYEGIGYNLRWIIENFRRDYKFYPNKVKLIGGGALSSVWPQIIADITKLEIEIMELPQFAGTRGAAMTAFVGLGKITFDKVKEILKVDKTVKPNPDNFDIYDKLFEDYKRLYFALKDVYKKANFVRFTS